MRRKLFFIFGCVLLIGGALAFAWYGYLQWDAFRVQRAANHVIHEQKTRNAESLHTRSIPHAIVIVPPHAGEPIGRIEISRLGLSAIILEGTAPRVLRVAAGHTDGTALPGAMGNIGIAAHRDTLFRPLKGVRPDDDIVLTMTYGTFRYKVDSTQIVDPSDVPVLHRTPDQELTLVTCYPFTYLGAAPKRFIVHARQQP